jgi:hypothetical protein
MYTGLSTFTVIEREGLQPTKAEYDALYQGSHSALSCASPGRELTASFYTVSDVSFQVENITACLSFLAGIGVNVDSLSARGESCMPPTFSLPPPFFIHHSISLC